MILPKQIAKFATVGISNTVVDFAVLNLFLQVFHYENYFTLFGKTFLIANIISVSVAMINSFIWNRKWTFASKGNNVLFQIVQFLIITIIGNYGVQQIVFNTLYGHYQSIIIPFLGMFAFLSKDFFRVNISKVFAVLCAGVWNFLGYKFFAFKKKTS